MKNDILKRIQDYALEEIMGDRFGKYAKEIILDRAFKLELHPPPPPLFTNTSVILPVSISK